jgi:hypothetical protein
MPITKWREEAYDTKRNEVYQESFDNLIEDMMTPLKFKIHEDDDDWRERIPEEFYNPVVNGNTVTVHRRNVPVSELVDLEKTYRAIKDIVADTEELDYVLNESFEYYSDRRTHLNNRIYSEGGHLYPNQKHRGGGSTRVHTRNNFQRRY